MKRIITGMATLIAMITTLLVGGVIAASSASAHTPSSSASCNGITLTGTNYESGQTNRWSMTVNGVTQSGTFGQNFSKTIPVPQDGTTSTYSVSIDVVQSNQYDYAKSGSVGPCGSTSVTVPVAPQKVDECNPEGVSSNIHWVSVPPSTADYTVTGTSTSNLTFTLKTDKVRKWSDGTTAPKTFVLGPDNGVICVTTVAIPVAPSSQDECNPAGVTNNVTWTGIPADTSDYTVTGTLTGDLTFTLKPNRKWSDGTTAPKVFHLPADSGEVCPTPPCTKDCTPPPPCDVCHMPIQASTAPPVTVCTGVLANKVLKQVRVPRGASCTLVDSYVNGSVVSNGGRSITLADTPVVQDIRLNHITGDVLVGPKGGRCQYDPQVGGSIVVKNSHNVLVCNTTICKDLVLKGNDGRITVKHVTARKVVVRGNREFVADGRADHGAMAAIRLLKVHAEQFVIRGNDPRHVIQK